MNYGKYDAGVPTVPGMISMRASRSIGLKRRWNLSGLSQPTEAALKLASGMWSAISPMLWPIPWNRSVWIWNPCPEEWYSQSKLSLAGGSNHQCIFEIGSFDHRFHETTVGYTNLAIGNAIKLDASGPPQSYAISLKRILTRELWLKLIHYKRNN